MDDPLFVVFKLTSFQIRKLVGENRTYYISIYNCTCGSCNLEVTAYFNFYLYILSCSCNLVATKSVYTSMLTAGLFSYYKTVVHFSRNVISGREVENPGWVKKYMSRFSLRYSKYWWEKQKTLF